MKKHKILDNPQNRAEHQRFVAQFEAYDKMDVKPEHLLKGLEYRRYQLDPEWYVEDVIEYTDFEEVVVEKVVPVTPIKKKSRKKSVIN